MKIIIEIDTVNLIQEESEAMFGRRLTETELVSFLQNDVNTVYGSYGLPEVRAVMEQFFHEEFVE